MDKVIKPDMQKVEEANLKIKNIRHEIDVLVKCEEEELEENFNDLSKEQLGEIITVSNNFNNDMKACVYFVRNKLNGLIKIGKTTNFKNRLAEIKQNFKFCGMDEDLETLFLHVTFPEHLAFMEKYYHNYFSEYNYKGEWFKIPKNLLLDWEKCLKFFNMGFYKTLNNGKTLVTCCNIESNSYENKYKIGFEIDPLEFLYKRFGRKIVSEMYSCNVFNRMPGLFTKNPLLTAYDLICQGKVAFQYEVFREGEKWYKLLRNNDNILPITYEQFKKSKIDYDYFEEIISH
jgi:hypothetical protein